MLILDAKDSHVHPHPTMDNKLNTRISLNSMTQKVQDKNYTTMNSK